jgi:hypothetical protein
MEAAGDDATSVCGHIGGAFALTVCDSYLVDYLMASRPLTPATHDSTTEAAVHRSVELSLDGCW